MNITATVNCFSKTLGEKCITNEDLSKMMDTSDEWITQRSGIKTRYWANNTTQTSDLATQAAKITMGKSNNSKFDALIAATLSPDHFFPGLGVLVQNKLGLDTIPAYDVRQQCSGFLYGLEVAISLITTKKYKRILFVCAEIQSRGLDLSTKGRDVAVLFGDGAGACIIEQAQDPQCQGLTFDIIDTELHSDGSGCSDLWCELPGSVAYASALTKEMLNEGRAFPKMNGRKVFETAVKRMTEVSLSLLSRNKIRPEEVKLFVPHQANLRINSMVAKQLGLKEDQAFSTIQKYGNTTSATIPIGMSDAIDASVIKPGDIILQAAFGSGFTWGSSLLKAR